MSVVAEFVGGPLDGELRVMEDARTEWRFPLLSPVPLDPAAPIEFDHAIYRVSARRKQDAPTGDPVLRFVFVA